MDSPEIKDGLFQWVQYFFGFVPFNVKCVQILPYTAIVQMNVLMCSQLLARSRACFQAAKKLPYFASDIPKPETADVRVMELFTDEKKTDHSWSNQPKLWLWL